MALIDDLKQRRFEAQTRVRNCEEQIDTYQRSLVGWTQRVNDLDICIAALEPPPAAVTEPEPEPSALTTWGQHEELRRAGFVPVGAPDDDGPVKWERRDHSDDASEFSEEGYAPVIDPEPSPLIDAQTCEPGEPDIPALIASGEHSYDEVAAIAYPEEPTKPEADFSAKALDHYDPKAMAHRDRFNPFGMFRKEGDQ